MTNQRKIASLHAIVFILLGLFTSRILFEPNFKLLEFGSLMLLLLIVGLSLFIMSVKNTLKN